MINKFLHNQISKAYGSKYVNKVWNGKQWVYKYNNSIGRIEASNFSTKENQYQQYVADQIVECQELLKNKMESYDIKNAEIKTNAKKISQIRNKNYGPYGIKNLMSYKPYKKLVNRNTLLKKERSVLVVDIKDLRSKIVRLNNYA